MGATLHNLWSSAMVCCVYVRKMAFHQPLLQMLSQSVPACLECCLCMLPVLQLLPHISIFLGSAIAVAIN